jgi:hypothetical protein
VNNLQIINFENAIASVKEGQTVDESKLRQTKVYAKLMLAKGTRLVDKQFQYSESGAMIRATAFILGNMGQIINVDKLFVNIDPNKSTLYKNNSMYYVELIHPKFEHGEIVDF